MVSHAYRRASRPCRVDLALTHAAACAGAMARESFAQRGGDFMATYTIIRVYEVPGKDQIDASNIMMEALELRVEKDFHVRDYIRPAEAKPGTGKPVDLTP